VRENRTHASTGGDWKRNPTASPRQPPTQPCSHTGHSAVLDNHVSHFLSFRSRPRRSPQRTPQHNGIESAWALLTDGPTGTITNLGAKQTNVGNAGNQQRQRSQLTNPLACRYFRVPVRLPAYCKYCQFSRTSISACARNSASSLSPGASSAGAIARSRAQTSAADLCTQRKDSSSLEEK